MRRDSSGRDRSTSPGRKAPSSSIARPTIDGGAAGRTSEPIGPACLHGERPAEPSRGGRAADPPRTAVVHSLLDLGHGVLHTALPRARGLASIAKTAVQSRRPSWGGVVSSAAAQSCAGAATVCGPPSSFWMRRPNVRQRLPVAAVHDEPRRQSQTTTLRLGSMRRCHRSSEWSSPTWARSTPGYCKDLLRALGAPVIQIAECSALLAGPCERCITWAEGCAVLR